MLKHMNIKWHTLFTGTALFLLLTGTACASGGRETEPGPAGDVETSQQTDPGSDAEQRETIRGKISVKGSEPLSYLSLTTAGKKEYRITGPLEVLLRREYQYRQVTLAGKTASEAAGPGFPAEFEAEEIVAE